MLSAFNDDFFVEHFAGAAFGIDKIFDFIEVADHIVIAFIIAAEEIDFGFELFGLFEDFGNLCSVEPEGRREDTGFAKDFRIFQNGVERK